ncbi:MAG: VOC family protein [Bacteroidota bacterium]
MATQLFVNLPIQSTIKSNAFFKALGFEFNSMFSNEVATCLIINDSTFVMLLEHSHFKDFTKKEIANAHQTTEVLLAISKENRQEVNEFVDKAISLGAIEAREVQELDFMFSRAFSDLDGHIWEVVYMDLEAFLKSQKNNN